MLLAYYRHEAMTCFFSLWKNPLRRRKFHFVYWFNLSSFEMMFSVSYAVLCDSKNRHIVSELKSNSRWTSLGMNRFSAEAPSAILIQSITSPVRHGWRISHSSAIETDKQDISIPICYQSFVFLKAFIGQTRN